MHIIKLNIRDFDYIPEYLLAESVGKINKSLKIRMYIDGCSLTFAVYKDKKIICEGQDLNNAVKIYNSIEN